MAGNRGNRLRFAASPYLRQHGDNPVDWHPWGREAFDKARTEGKPVFLSIGYATCHWCHVMARESFSDPEVARFLNEHFVAIKVDRQELPQVDEFYMRAALLLNGQGGWPLSVFCTPEGVPFFAGTYFPPEPRFGLPSFLEVLKAVHQSWQEQSERLAELGQRIVAATAAHPASPQNLDLEALEARALAELEQEFDAENGGFGSAPKFPMPARLSFLLELGRRGHRAALDMLARSLDGMAQGGIRDPLFGGFHRYATDAAWFIPHYEKLLPDNALLAELYWEAGRAFRVPRWRKVGQEALRFVLSLWRTAETPYAWAPVDFAVVRQPYLAAGWDAESRGEEGRPFTFSLAELEEALDPQELRLILRLTPFAWPKRGRRPLALRPLDRQSARELGLPAGWSRPLSQVLRKLRKVAEGKGLPAVDDQAVSAWIAMALCAYARWLSSSRAGDTGSELRRAAQRREAENSPASPVDRSIELFLASAAYAPPHLEPLWAAEGLWEFGWQTSLRIPRTIHQGQPHSPETLEDLAWVTTAFLEIFLATGSCAWLERTLEILDLRVPLYRGPRGELFTTPEDSVVVPVRQRYPFDGAHPNPGAILCRTLYRCFWLTGDETYRQWADEAVACEAPFIAESPHNATSWLLAARAGRGVSMLVVSGDPAWPSTRALLRTAQRHRYRPDLVVFLDEWPPTQQRLRLLPVFRDRPAAGDGEAAAYLCVGTRCWPGVSDPGALARLLRETGTTQR